MKNVKKYSMFLLLLIITGCTQQKKEVAVLVYDQKDPFIENVASDIHKYNTTEYNITIYDCEKSQIRQNEIAERLYEEGVDLLIINPVERLSSYIFVEKSKKEKIPLIFFNREPLAEDLEKMEKAYYVGANAKASGIMQAELIAEAFEHSPNKLNQYDKNKDNVIQCLILKGEQGHQDAEDRTTAVIGELKKQGFQVEVLHTQIANWSENQAYRDMETMMEMYGNQIEVLISNNDAMAIGATKYLKEYEYFGTETNQVAEEVPFIIVGIDGLNEAIRFIENGYMYGTILNDGSSMAKAIVNLAKYILEDNEESLQYKLIDDKYIWIEYKNYTIE